MKGRIVYTWKEFVARCFACDETEVLHFRNRRDAEKAFRASGWRRRHGLWYCHVCITKENT